MAVPPRTRHQPGSEPRRKSDDLGDSAQLARGLVALATKLGGISDRRAAEAALLDAGMALGTYTSGGVYRLDDETGDFVLTVHAGMPEDFLAAAARSAADSSRARLLLAGFAVHARTDELRGLLGGHRFPDSFAALSIVPIIECGRVTGSLNLASRELAGDDVCALVEAFGAVASSAFARISAESHDRVSRFAVETSPLAVVIVTRDGQIRWSNRAMTLQSGWSPDELRRMKVADFAVGMHEEKWASTWSRLRRVGRDEFRGQHRRRDSSRMAVEVSAALTGEGEDEVACLTMRDLSEGERVREAVQHQHELLAAVVESLPVGVFAKDARDDLRFTLWNRRMETILGRSSAEVLGRTDFDLFPQAEAESFRRSDEAVLHQGQVVDIPFETVTAGPRSVPAHTIKVPIFDRMGQAVTLLGILEDLTEVKRVEQQLIQAQKMEAVGRLASGVAHDFNNLLQVISSIAQLLPEALGKKDDVAELLTELDQQIGRGGAMSRQLLLFARHEGMRPEPLDLNDVVRNSVRMLRRLVREGITIELDLASHPLPLDADRSQLEQILMNLAINAADAMPDGGIFTVRTDDDGGGPVVLEVSDSGCGIPPEVMGRVFEPFFTTKEFGRGTGLGLSVVQGIVLRHGGAITVASPGAGGTTFRITLPRGVAVVGGERGHPDATPPRGDGRRLLLVEDDPVLRRSLTEALTALGFQVVAQGTAEEALAPTSIPDPDAVVVDWVLPGMQGPGLAAEVRRRWPQARIVLVSGYAEGADKIAGPASWDAFLLKPFGVQRLIEALQVPPSS